MDSICVKCQEQCSFFARFCYGVPAWTCGACDKARREAAERYYFAEELRKDYAYRYNHKGQPA